MAKSKQNLLPHCESILSGEKMSLCRACLVLIQPEAELVHDLHNEKDLAFKFLSCTGIGLDALLPHQEETTRIVLKFICDSCCQLLQKFHDFQRMCQESLRNFEKLLQEVEFTARVQEQGEDEMEVTTTTTEEVELSWRVPSGVFEEQETVVKGKVEDVEEVYIMEETQLAAKEEEKVTGRPHLPSRSSNLVKRQRGQRHTINCNLCLRKFYKQSLLDAHLLKHKGQSSYSCVFCGKSYARANVLEAHLREIHQTDRDNHVCPHNDCQKVYSSQRSLKYHLNRQHSKKTDTPVHICEKCGKSYGSRAHLVRHQWVHVQKEQRPFECHHCSSRFYTKQFLGDHLLRRHSRARLWRCRICGRLAKSRLALIEHTRKTHTPKTKWRVTVDANTVI